MPYLRLAVLGAISAGFAVPTRAQFGDLLNQAQRKASDAVDKATTEALKPQSPQQSPAPKPADPTSAAGQPGPGSANSAAGAPSSPSAPAPGEVYGNRFDFVPGDKVLVYDDFSDTDVGEYPAKWTVKAIPGHNPGGGNSVEVVEIRGRRFLKSRYQEGHQESSMQFLRYPVKGDLPHNFTIEFDMDVAGSATVFFSDPRGWGGQQVEISQVHEPGHCKSDNATGRFAPTAGVYHVAIAVSGTQLKLYVGGERVLADPDGVVRPIARLGIEFPEPPAEMADHEMIGVFRLAEGGKPAKQMLAGEGRIVTHGILFDTGSDVIKPESGPTLRSILALLQEDPGLRFSIEGHTDDQGGAKVNGPLSDRRASAVKAWLVKQGVSGQRLQAKGVGATKPIDTNETAEGRANNRRVEFVKVAA